MVLRASHIHTLQHSLSLKYLMQIKIRSYVRLLSFSTRTFLSLLILVTLKKKVTAMPEEEEGVSSLPVRVLTLPLRYRGICLSTQEEDGRLLQS